MISIVVRYKRESLYTFKFDDINYVHWCSISKEKFVWSEDLDIQIISTGIRNEHETNIKLTFKLFISMSDGKRQVYVVWKFEHLNYFHGCSI